MFLTLKIWQEAILMKKSAPSYVFTPSHFIVKYMNMLVENEWQVTGYRSLNSHGVEVYFFFFTPTAKIHFFFHFYCIKVDRIIVALELQSFIALFSFCSLIFHRWYPASVSLKRCLSWQPHSAVFKIKQSTHKVKSYQSCSLLNSNKLAVTFWVHCFYFDAGLSGIFFILNWVFLAKRSISSM